MPKKLKVLDLFSGAGMFSLGLERTGGFETVAFCEIWDQPRKVLKKHWSSIKCYRDVTKMRGTDIGTIDVICGGFPCQDLSSAGDQKGLNGTTRSSLFREMLRLADETIRPVIIFENVASLLSGPKESPGEWFYNFLTSLAEIRYSCEWVSITAASIGAAHERDRVWIIAYPNETQLKRGGISERIYKKHAELSDSCWRKDKPGVDRALNGNATPMDMHRLGIIGNSIVPEIPELIGNAILEELNNVSRMAKK